MSSERSTRQMLQWLFVSVATLIFVYSLLWSSTGLLTVLPLRVHVATMRHSLEQTIRMNEKVRSWIKEIKTPHFEQKMARQVLQLTAPSETIYTNMD